jgi:hypothetical protein
MRCKYTLVFVFCLFLKGHSQNPINAYARVTAISGTSLSVSNVNETYHSFENGDYVIIMQMQDNVIGTNTTNASTFGDLGSIQSAGLYEVARISSHTEVASVPNSITLANALVNTYNINANSSVQLVTFRFLGTNFTSTANIGTLAWTGSIGGITAMSVSSTFTLIHNITADGSGFAGGVKNTPNGYTACDNATYATTLATRYAGKGEGIYKRTATGFAAGRGKILNGGGGGNDVNAGGGGGGNYSAGGGGGSGWVAAGTGCNPVVGGLGGLSLSGQISGARIFMGGGGGGGHENDGNGTVGAPGGGIIFIKTSTLVTTTCAGISISANGSSAVAASNDGAGGGGAGGTIVFSVNTFSVAGACPLTISANGGNGGNSNAASTGAHGGGGGGGQGAIIYSAAQPSANVTTSTSSGTGGVSCSTCSGTLNGSVGSGTTNSGVVINASGPLPIELVSFEATLNEYGEVVLTWRTAVEENSEGFIVQKLNLDNTISELGRVDSKGSYSTYYFADKQPAYGVNYYRLKQIDKDGTEYLKPWIAIKVAEKRIDDIILIPNPAGYGQNITAKFVNAGKPDVDIQIYGLEARLINEQHFDLKDSDTFEIKTSLLRGGIYIMKVNSGNSCFFKKIVISE